MTTRGVVSLGPLAVACRGQVVSVAVLGARLEWDAPSEAAARKIVAAARTEVEAREYAATEEGAQSLMEAVAREPWE